MDTVVQKVWPTPFQPFLWGVFRVLGCFARSFDVFGKSTRNVGHSSFIPQFGQGSKKLVIPRNTYTNSLSPDCVLSTRPTGQLLHKPCMQSIAAISLCSKNCLEQLFTTSFFVFAYGAINDPCVFAIFADWRQVALEIDACRTDVTSLGWGGVGMLTFMLTCVTCTTDVTPLGWGGVGMLTFMLTCVTCTTDVTSLGWGGVGMLTFMLTCVTCTTDVTSLGWGGVGMLTFMLTCVTCTTDVTSLGWVGVGMLTFMLTCVTCTTDVTSLGWGGVGMLTFMLTCVTCTTDVASLGWGGVGMLTFMLTCVTCTTDVTSLGWGGVGMLTFMWKELGKLAKKSRR